MVSKITIQPGVIEVSGEDAKSFLNALVSNEIENVALSQSIPSLLLDPAGKTMSTFWLYRSKENVYLLVCQKSNVETLMSMLKKFCIRTKAEINDVSNDYSAVVCQDLENSMLLEEHHCNSEGANLYLVNRQEENQHQLYDDFRISNGAVSLEHDLLDGSIAQEASLDDRAISFNKGCFLGQELVCRIDSRSASTPFSFFSATLDAVQGLSYNDEITSGEEVIGNITSVISEEKIGEKFFGGKTAIVKLSRKGVAALATSGSIGQLEILSDEKVVGVSNLEKVNGYFSC